MVPRTGLVSMASPSFFYEQSDRKKWEKGDKDLPAKVSAVYIPSICLSTQTDLNVIARIDVDRVLPDFSARLHQRERLFASASLA